jgi:hypothetical protein
MCNSSGPVFPGVRVAASLHTSARLPHTPCSPLLPAAAAKPQSPSPVLSLCCLPARLHLTSTTSLSTHRRRLLRPHRRSTRHSPFHPPIPIHSHTQSSARSSPKKRWQGSTCALLSCPTNRVSSRDRPSSYLSPVTPPAPPHN